MRPGPPGNGHEQIQAGGGGDTEAEALGYPTEKIDTMSRYSDIGEAASPSACSSTALSALPLLAPGLASPTVSPSRAEPETAQARRFHFSWDDPPPTPEFRPVSWRASEVAAYRRSQGGDGILMAVSENLNLPRNSTHAVAALSPEEEGSEIDLGQPPEYSRY
ncbi:hypothetical protein OH77DRAFT_1155926 [Trametes cingulata]|nr:hypothetical protein OH77DRAFT_1155926 [Trametes cingulata]